MLIVIFLQDVICIFQRGIMSDYNSDDYVTRYIELMNSWRSCWSSCSSGNGGYFTDDDIEDLFQQLCTKDSCGCSEECEDCSCKKKPNSQTVQDDGCFCRNPKCNEFVPMAEPDGDDGKILCWKCANSIW